MNIYECTCTCTFVHLVEFVVLLTKIWSKSIAF